MGQSCATTFTGAIATAERDCVYYAVIEQRTSLLSPDLLHAACKPLHS